MRRFTLLTVVLASAVAFLVGVIIAGGLTPGPWCRVGAARRSRRSAEATKTAGRARVAGVVNFADVAERINAAVVNIDATSKNVARAAARGDELDRRAATSRARARDRAAASSSIARASSSRIITSSTAPSGSRSRWRTAGRSAGEVVGADPAIDVALLRIPADGRPAGGAARELRRPARRRVGLRDRQPARLRPLGHGRRRQLHRPEAVRREPRRLHPDRRGDQFRQQRRAADQLARRSGRHQFGDQLARQQHRVRRADQPGGRDSAAAQGARPGVARLHRRRADRRHAGAAARAEPDGREGGDGSGRHRRARRPSAPACTPTTSSSRSRAVRSSTTKKLIRDISARQPGTVARLEHRPRRPARRRAGQARRASGCASARRTASRIWGRRPRPRQPEPTETPLGLTVRELDRSVVGRLEIPGSRQRRGHLARRSDRRRLPGAAPARLRHHGDQQAAGRHVADYQRIVAAAQARRHPGALRLRSDADPAVARDGDGGIVQRSRMQASSRTRFQRGRLRRCEGLCTR